jgi:hypothetical protein
MMKRFFALALAAALALAGLSPAAAQFADQATYAGAGAGTANAQTLTLPNATSLADLVGVIVKYVPNVGNTGDATLTVNSFAGSPPHFRKPTGTGLAALTGGELVAAQPVWIMYDGTYFDLMSGQKSATVTSVAASVPAEMTVGGSPVTGAGTLAIGWASASGAKFIGTPAGGGSGAYAGRAIVPADVTNGMKAWAYFTVSGGTVTLVDSYNVTSVTRNANGDFTLNMTTATADTGYAVSGVTTATSTTTILVQGKSGGTRTTSAYEFVTNEPQTGFVDPVDCSIMIVGN